MRSRLHKYKKEKAMDGLARTCNNPPGAQRVIHVVYISTASDTRTQRQSFLSLFLRKRVRESASAEARDYKTEGPRLYQDNLSYGSNVRAVMQIEHSLFFFYNFIVFFCSPPL